MRMTYRGTADSRQDAREQFRTDPTALLHIDDEEAARIAARITDFYRDHLDTAGLRGYVIGLSGGIDSSTVAHLLVDAVGPERVHGVIMPAEHSDPAHVEDAAAVAEQLGITTSDYNQFQDRIGDAVDILTDLGEPVDDADTQRLKRGNVLARCRMIVLRDVAKARDALVAGTTNASERDLGYMTLAADGKGGIDNEGLYGLYKTTERDLARYLGVPDHIVEKPPTADLWQGQTDEAELGFSYTVLDQVLLGLQLDIALEKIAETVDDVDIEAVRRIHRQVQHTAYKRELAPHPEL